MISYGNRYTEEKDFRSNTRYGKFGVSWKPILMMTMPMVLMVLIAVIGSLVG